METDPAIGFDLPLLLVPPQENKINKQFEIFYDNN